MSFYRENSDYGNLKNFRTMPLIESYWGYYYKAIRDEKTGKTFYSNEAVLFQFSDGTEDSYVKRGFDEEYVQKITRREGLEQAYRIMVTSPHIDFKPEDMIMIGTRKLFIRKVLPLMNVYDAIKHFNFRGDVYRRMAPKLIYML